MKPHSVVVMTLDQVLEVSDGLRRCGIIQLDHDALRLLLLADLNQHNRRLRPCSDITWCCDTTCQEKYWQKNQGKQGSGIHEPVTWRMLSGVFPPVKGSRAKRGELPSAALRFIEAKA